MNSVLALQELETKSGNPQTDPNGPGGGISSSSSSNVENSSFSIFC